ncbi:haloacid dehalogenase [Nocardioides szechwanensis]|uniref:Haloacid Dehalogenase Superfamily Class (Subfamily) IIA n=1 Tax=Nocardioides szechwanensis TaxID=1005944 RepID=A0A1G9XQN9_9ACTN|nr:HAD-IIA family hydrolase [Nocardioides szechwanensis]GEP32235.1 haloacid dehalogenase [Nocardioides szechwanensis]SDM99142.1 Haloacid Dehalogenase Superfamily Class (subfamily) IIA [Nocardioides szechwanensis]
MLGVSQDALCSAYDLAMLDLDGVVYIGPDAVPGAAEHLDRVRESGMRLAFVTNNAARTPEAVATHLRELGVQADAGDVVTSAQAAARVLVERLGEGARVVLLGAVGLAEALAEVGLVAVSVEEEAEALVTGYGPEVLWRDIMRAAVRVRAGLWWVASNSDYTIPTSYGVAPGHGVLVETLSRFTGVDPVVAGKPQRPLLDETVRRAGGERPLMVGDRLDTDIEGARTAGIDSLLVLTGVTGLPELVAATPAERPTFVAADLGGLLRSHEVPAEDGSGWELGGWRAEVTEAKLEVAGDGGADDWWAVVACAAWAHVDGGGDVPDTSHLAPPLTGRAAEAR